MKNTIYLFIGILCLISCSKDNVLEKEDGNSVAALSFMSVLTDPFALQYENIGYVYLQSYSPTNTLQSVAFGAQSKNNSMSSFSVNEIDVPLAVNSTNTFGSTFYNNDITESQTGSYDIEINNNSKSFSEVGLRLLEDNNRIIKNGTNYSWELENYTGPTWFGIKQNVMQNGQVINNVEYYYESVADNTIDITSSMLNDFPNNTKVTIYIGIANYVSDNDDLFVVGHTTRSYTYTVNK